jgi:Anti-sigma-28 factor, FlgM
MTGSGKHPMRRRPRGADLEDMMVLHPRTTGRDRSAAPADGRRARFRRADRLAAPDRAARVAQLKAEIAAGTYRPDPGAIAAAVVERLAAAPRRQCS